MDSFSTFTKVFNQSELSKYGFELHPFRVSWYNDLVDESLRLKCEEDRGAVLIISTPSLYDSLFLPFLKQLQFVKEEKEVLDPLDMCIKNKVDEMTRPFAPFILDLIYDFDRCCGQVPKLHMQSVGHVSGTAYYYRPSELPDDYVKAKSFHGCSLHPCFGGWFGFRAVVVTSFLWPVDMPRPEPVDVFSGNTSLIYDFLHAFNTNWYDNIWRSFAGATEKYPDPLITYFCTHPKERWNLIKKWTEQV